MLRCWPPLTPLTYVFSRGGGGVPGWRFLPIPVRTCAERCIYDVTIGDFDRLLRFDIDALGLSTIIRLLNLVTRRSCHSRVCHCSALLCWNTTMGSPLPEDGRG